MYGLQHRPVWCPADVRGQLQEFQIAGLLRVARGYAPNTTVFRQYDACSQQSLLVSGMIKLIRETDAGGRHVVALRYPGQLVDPLGVNGIGERQHSAITLVPSQIADLAIPSNVVSQSQARRSAFLYEEFLRRELAYAWTLRQTTRELSLPCLLYDLLQDICATIGRDNGAGARRFVLPLTNGEMADLLGVSETRFKQVREFLGKRGLMSRSRRSYVLKKEPKREHAKQ